MRGALVDFGQLVLDDIVTVVGTGQGRVALVVRVVGQERGLRREARSREDGCCCVLRKQVAFDGPEMLTGPLCKSGTH